MESTLHRQIKESLAAGPDLTEVRYGRYWIDAIDAEGRFVEVQFAGLAAIARKVSELCSSQSLRIIKPLLARRYVETVDRRGQVVRCRKSPKQLDQFAEIAELLHFTNTFPQANLQIEFWRCEVTETRLLNARGRKPARTIDYRLRGVVDRRVVRSAADLWSLLPGQVATEQVVSTRCLAQAYQVEEWQARQVAYVLCRCGALKNIGKRGNSKLYQRAA